MRGQKFQFGSEEWPKGKGVLQVYAPVALERNSALAVLISKFRQAMTGSPVVAVEDRYLHVTIDVIAGATEDRISESERAELVTALHKALSDVPSFQGSVGPAVAGGTGAKMYISPAAPLELVQRRVREVIRAVRGDAAATWIQPRPHVTTHFCTLPEGQTTDSDPWSRKLYKAADALVVPLEISEVMLVDVRADNGTCAFTWTAASEPIPLAASLLGRT